MATYLIVNTIFALATLGLLRFRYKRPSREWLIMLGVLLVLTAIFDSMLVYFDVVNYTPENILGIHIGYAPIEDFFYAVYAAAIVPLLWRRFGGERD